MTDEITLLLIEDNIADAELIKEILAESTVIKNILFIDNGEEALSYLTNSNTIKPNLIILDLNLPKLNGLEILQKIKTTDKIKVIPVIIFSSSANENDIYKSYYNYANCYITKPNNLANYFETINQIEKFWFEYSKHPKKEMN